MDSERKTVAASFDSRAEAQAAIEALRAAGIDSSRIGILSRVREGDAAIDSGDNSVWEKGAMIGAGLGAAAGAGVGFALAATLVPGIGTVLAGGLLVATLGGAGSGAVAGGTFGGLLALGIPDGDAQFLDREFAAGHTVIAVQVDGDTGPVMEIFRRHNARDHRIAGADLITSTGRTTTLGSLD